MNRFRKRFTHRHVVLPVIHAESEEQTVRNVIVARNAGADGVFLINHAVSDAGLLEIRTAVTKRFPDLWVGVNCLGLSLRQVFEIIPDDTDGLWADNAGIQEKSSFQDWAETVLAIRNRRNWSGLYFGGVAFKYQRPVENLALAATIARQYMDVVTTSGPGTGWSASVEKIRAMKEALGDFPLAIASGVTPENVTDYLGIADCFLVATGISKLFEELDASLLEALLKKVRR